MDKLLKRLAPIMIFACAGLVLTVGIAQAQEFESLQSPQANPPRRPGRQETPRLSARKRSIPAQVAPTADRQTNSEVARQ